jgi:23S rRNA (cytosine1962-C5)-methyltransferase
MKSSHVLVTPNGPDYELIDSGGGEKLERFGKVVLSRPDPQALWKKNDLSLWKNIDASFNREEKGSNWEIKSGTPDKWDISFGGLQFWIKPTTFKHVGLFPEQSVNWSWMKDIIEVSKASGRIFQSTSSTSVVTESSAESTSPNVLNLFAYTGGATLACAAAGANVVHVDGSKVAVSWARENAELSGLEKKPVRWILEDVPTFVKREIKRGRKYDGIIMDPPSFGHGPDSQLWKIEDSFLGLIDDCMQLLSDKPLFFLINGYSAGYSAIAYENNLLALKNKFGGEIEIGELALEESSSGKNGRLLPAGIFARWKA